MADPWTGLTGTPVPPELRHRKSGAREMNGRPVAVCDCGWWWLQDERKKPHAAELCGVAVARRLAELETREASLHKHASRAVGSVVAYLRGITIDPSARKAGPKMVLRLAADAIERGEHAEWREANSEPPKDPR